MLQFSQLPPGSKELRYRGKRGRRRWGVGRVWREGQGGGGGGGQ